MPPAFFLRLVLIIVVASGAACATNPTSPSATSSSSATPLEDGSSTLAGWSLALGGGATAGPSTVDWDEFNSASASLPHGGVADDGDPAPPRLSTPEVNGTTVTLRWTANAFGCCEFPARYIIQYSTTPNFSGPIGRLTTQTAATSLTIQNVPPGRYYVEILALYELRGRVIGPSNTQEITVANACSPPTAPVLTSQVTGSNVFLAWTRAASDDVYFIEVNGSVVISAWPHATYTSPNTPNGTYRLRVRTSNQCGDSGWSAPITITVSVAPPPGPPTTLRIVSWSGQVSITFVRDARSVFGGYYSTTGSIQLVVNIPVTGRYRAEFNSYPFIGAWNDFSGQTRLDFTITDFRSSSCPDFHGTIPLYLFHASNTSVPVASINTTHRGTGCAFNLTDLQLGSEGTATGGR